jgi:hypothetical protein
MAFYPFPLPVRNSNRYTLVVPGTNTPLTNYTLSDILGIEIPEAAPLVTFEAIEFQRLPGEFIAQPPGAGEQ